MFLPEIELLWSCSSWSITQHFSVWIEI